SRRRHTRSKRDWSSDVCSSDLAAVGCGSTGTPVSSIVTRQWQWGARSAGTRGGRWIGRTCAYGLVVPAVASKVGSSMSWHMPCKIGRASCRERVEGEGGGGGLE